MPSEDLAELVYIGGYGRSGSTLLEYLLAAADPTIVACGEVARHLLRFRARRTCTCGRPARKCPVWGPFQLGPERFEGWTHERLTLDLLERVSWRYAAMADSSKTAWGSWTAPFRLAASRGDHFILIHIVRDPRAVCWSALRTPVRTKQARRSWTRAGLCVRTALGWVTANLVCEVFGNLYPKRYLRLRYEDLARSPDLVLADVLGRIPRAPRKLPKTVNNRHQLYGNRIRFKQQSVAAIQEDVAWKKDMPHIYRWLAILLSWPLAVKYRYLWF